MVKQIQGSSPYLQGSSPNLQGSSYPLQVTASPQRTSKLNINQMGSNTIKLSGGDGKNGVFWVGQDGNIWTKDNNGKYKNQGPNNGTFDTSKWRQIADWKDGQKNTGDANASASAGGGVTYPDLSGAIAILRENIKGLDPVYQAEVNKAIKNYEIAEAERLGEFNKTKAASDASGITNDQTVLQARNAINKNARVASEDIISILGSLGMSGSTTKNALNSTADKSNENMNSSNFEYGKNKQSILQNWNDYVNEDKGYQQQLADKKTTDIANAGIQKAKDTKDYLGQIAGNQVNMGQFDTSGTLGEIATQNKTIGDLSNVPTTYTGVKPTYAAPAISDLLGQNIARFDVEAGTGAKRSAPKLIKVNEQVASGDKYGIA